MELRLSCYLVLLSIDSKTRQQDSHSSVTWPISTWESHSTKSKGTGNFKHHNARVISLECFPKFRHTRDGGMSFASSKPDLISMEIFIMLSFLWYTVECYYDAVHYNMILHISLQELRQNINQKLNPLKTSYTLPWRAIYWVSFMNIFAKIDRIITALHCIWTWLCPCEWNFIWTIPKDLFDDTWSAII